MTENQFVSSSQLWAHSGTDTVTRGCFVKKMLFRSFSTGVLALFRRAFLGLLTDAHGTPRISHNDEIWRSYTSPKEDPKNI